MLDLYEVLQVHPRAEHEVIRAAYRALARLRHPDAGGVTGGMALLNHAWSVLGTPARRSAYDAVRGSQPLIVSTAPVRPPSAGSGGEAPATPPPAGPQAGTVLDFGRYAGWSLQQLANHDPVYLEWLERTPIGRPYRREIDEVLGRNRAAAAQAPVATAERPRRRRWGR